MKSAPASIASQRGAAHVVVGRQLAGLEDHLEVGASSPQASLTATISSKTSQVVAGQEGAAVDDHVDLVGAGRDRVRGVGELDRAARPGRWGTRWRRGDVDAAAAPAPRAATATRSRVDADRGDLRAWSGRPGRGGAPWRTARGPCRGCRRPRAWSGRSSRWPGRCAHALAVVLIDRVPRPAARASRADLVDAGQAVQEASQARRWSAVPTPSRSRARAVAVEELTGRSLRPRTGSGCRPGPRPTAAAGDRGHAVRARARTMGDDPIQHGARCGPRREPKDMKQTPPETQPAPRHAYRQRSSW